MLSLHVSKSVYLYNIIVCVNILYFVVKLYILVYNSECLLNAGFIYKVSIYYHSLVQVFLPLYFYFTMMQTIVTGILWRDLKGQNTLHCQFNVVYIKFNRTVWLTSNEQIVVNRKHVTFCFS